jgi:Protein of unknown function (DUF3987)
MSVNNIYRSDEFFRQVAEQKLWTAWRTEKRLNKTTGELKETKVPYCGIGIKSESDDPATWINIEDAAQIAETEGFINGGGGGIGIFLGIEYGTEYRLGGVDLDTCLSPDKGLTPWAKEVIDRFDTYGEISPSRTGVKLYFLYGVADLDPIRLITGTHWSKNFKERTGSDHAPGFELHIGHRYFAMTGDLYDGCPEILRVIEVEDIAWLINEVGQRFTRPELPDTRSAQSGKATSSSSSQKRDHSRSGAAASRLMSLWVDGFVETYEQARERLLNDSDPDIVAWMIEKGLERRGRKDEYEFRRLWDWVREKPKSYATTTMEEAMRLIADEAAQPGEDSAQEETGNEKQWFDDLAPIDPWDAITSPPTFSPDMAPASLVNYAVDVAARLGNNPEYVLSAMLAACAGVINDEIVIQPDELDTRWTESARLWVCGVGHSGVGKTPAKNAAMQPIKGVEAAWKQQDDIRHRQWLLDREIYENEYTAWEKAVRDGGTDLPPIEPEEPKYRQIIVDDMTMEALGRMSWPTIRREC